MNSIASFASYDKASPTFQFIQFVGNCEIIAFSIKGEKGAERGWAGEKKIGEGYLTFGWWEGYRLLATSCETNEE